VPVESSAEQPLPVRRVSQLLTQWIDRLGAVWVEGQVTQVTRRPGQATVFLTLRDPVADMSVTVTCHRALLDAIPGGLSEGAHVVVHAKARFFAGRGTLSFAADDLRPVGVGELLARLEQLRAVLAAEGLFAADRKRALPFLPTVVGLICGRASAAEQDVVENAKRRWPAVQFRIEEVAVQGPSAVTDVTAALQRLEEDARVDVIVITRGGGSIEDLLPFSNEALVRAVAACRTPIVSAIGHESDAPLLNYVADVAASTPTDAARRVVPDLGEERRKLGELHRRARECVHRRLATEAELMSGLPARLRRAVQARVLSERADTVQLQQRARRCFGGQLAAARADLVHVGARIAALSPQATLDRGYAVVQLADGRIVREPPAAAGTLRVRVAHGEFEAVAQ
jgi:exodeoxyribonuclease VII large subunit